MSTQIESLSSISAKINKYGKVLRTIEGPTKHVRIVSMIYSHWRDGVIISKEEYISPEKTFWEVTCEIEEEFWGIRKKIFELASEEEAQKFIPDYEYHIDTPFKPV